MTYNNRNDLQPKWTMIVNNRIRKDNTVIVAAYKPLHTTTIAQWSQLISFQLFKNIICKSL